MHIGILGCGNMGGTVGARLALAGHTVTFGARRHEAAEYATQLARAAGAADVHAAGLDEAAAAGDAILYTIRRENPGDILAEPSQLAGKVVIDLNNNDIPQGFAYEPVTAAVAEKLQANAPQARVVKAFNTLARPVFEHDAATLKEWGVTVFVAGDDAAANETVAGLASDMGFQPVLSGGLRNARLLESAADLIRYFILGAGHGPFATLNVIHLPSQCAYALDATA